MSRVSKVVGCRPLGMRLRRPDHLPVAKMHSLGITPDGLGLDADEVGQICSPTTAKEFLRLGVEAPLRPLHGRWFVVAIPHTQIVRNGEPEDREDQIPRADGPSFFQLQATLSS